MPPSPHADFDHTVLDMIEHSPMGAVPRTPTYDEAVARLHASQQAFHNADHPECHVTARSLARLPRFFASDLQEYFAGAKGAGALESNLAIFDRYVQALPAAVRAKAEPFRLGVAGRAVRHRPKAGAALAEDPLHTLFLVPGAGPQPGLPGNYLHGVLEEKHEAPAEARWCIQISDSDNDVAVCAVATRAEIQEKFQEILDSVPFHLTELEALGFTLH